jgi:hypothetical protein
MAVKVPSTEPLTVISYFLGSVESGARHLDVSLLAGAAQRGVQRRGAGVAVAELALDREGDLVLPREPLLGAADGGLIRGEVGLKTARAGTAGSTEGDLDSVLPCLLPQVVGAHSDVRDAEVGEVSLEALGLRSRGGEGQQGQR